MYPPGYDPDREWRQEDERQAFEILRDAATCPFCGGKKLSMHQSGSAAAYVHCVTCGGSGPIGKQEDIGEKYPGAANAGARWNDRPSGWNYDMAALPTSQMVEVAFDGSLGMCNVQVCQKVSWSEKANRADEYHREGSEADLSRGWRPYAWRHIPVPPRKP